MTEQENRNTYIYCLCDNNLNGLEDYLGNIKYLTDLISKRIAFNEHENTEGLINEVDRLNNMLNDYYFKCLDELEELQGKLRNYKEG